MSIPLGNFIETTTRDHFFPGVVDNYYEGNSLFKRMRGSQRPWPGGKKVQKSTTLSGRTSGGSYSGFDAFITTQEDVRKLLSESPSQYYWDVALNGIQLATNKGKEAFVDVMAAEFEDVVKAIEDDMGTDLYGDGSGNNSKALNGLVYHVDDSTNVTTYEGLSRSTYAKLKSTLTTQGGAIALSDLAADHDSAQVGNDHPTIGVTTPAIFTLLEALMTFTYNVNVGAHFPNVASGGASGAHVQAGVSSIAYRGVPIISDEKCTAANFYFLNENHLFLYTLDHSPEMVSGSKEGFAWTGWKKSQNQDAIVGQILWAGQLFGDSPRTMTRRTNILT